MVERASKQGLPCPVCKVDLVMTERQNVEIDYCPKCRGVWLDRGELDKIIERSGPAAPAPRPAPSYAQHGGHQHSGYGHGYGKPHKRKKSFFEEIFD